MDDMNLGLPPHISRALERLDARADKRAAAVDVDRIEAAVMARLRGEDTPRVRARRFAWRGAIRIAAAIAVFVTAGATTMLLITNRAPTTPAPARLPSVDARTTTVLTAERADTVLKAMDKFELNAPLPTSSASVDQLNTQELRAVLQAMQSSEGGSE